MTTAWTNREILKSYFRGIIDLQIEYMVDCKIKPNT